MANLTKNLEKLKLESKSSPSTKGSFREQKSQRGSSVRDKEAKPGTKDTKGAGAGATGGPSSKELKRASSKRRSSKQGTFQINQIKFYSDYFCVKKLL